MLPPNALVQVFVQGSAILDEFWRPIDCDGDGEGGDDDVFEFTTLTVTTLPGTAVCGRVFASEEMLGGDGMPINCPLAGVRVTVDGEEDTLFTTTDMMGNFRLEPAPVGRFFVHIDGRSATNPDIPAGAYYPFVGKTWESLPGAESNVGDIFLPLIVEGTLTAVSQSDDTMVTLPSEVVAERPELAGIELMVPQDSLYADDGTRGGMVGIAPVEPDRLPGSLPDGLDFPVVITVQTDGATNFDQPVPVRFPNLPDAETGVPLPAGSKTALWSFNHDTGRFEVVGPMTVSADGLWVESDPGVGILAPGWHGWNPGTNGGGGCACNSCNDCKRPDGCDPNVQCCEQEDEDSGLTDPVALATGEFYENETDLVIKGRGFDFQWSRRYASKEGTLTNIGHGWDVNYNISVQRSGRLMKLRHGKSYEDILFEEPNGKFCRREYFLELEEKATGECEMTFGNQDKWAFHELDHPTCPGAIESMTDRNGNTMTFAYDAEGRLVTITDTLGRDITVAYNTDGFIESVTDFTGRQVSYEYYQDGDDGGSFGDLKSVTLPAVVGTPHGNDFPNGKKRTYTYTKGFSDERLNHNLLTITDGRRNDPGDATFGEGPYVINFYSSERTPGEPTYDRIIRQEWGGDWIDFSYQALPIIDGNLDGPVLTTIVNDRNGNVSEHVFNALNQKLSDRYYTGRANPTERYDVNPESAH